MYSMVRHTVSSVLSPFLLLLPSRHSLTCLTVSLSLNGINSFIITEFFHYYQILVWKGTEKLDFGGFYYFTREKYGSDYGTEGTIRCYLDLCRLDP